MRCQLLSALIAIAILALLPAKTCADPTGAPRGKDNASAAPPNGGGLQSGVYGFSGALKGGASLSGVIGECIWIYDSTNRRQVAKGNCDEGKFRVPLPPGQYVVRGPGGNQKIDVKPHKWIKVESLARLPGNL